MATSLRVAVEGCGHGTLDDIYAAIAHAAKLKEWETVDLVIICGDFQAVRNPTDLNTMSVPPKYRSMGDFWAYYNGSRVAPYLTIFIGGNHEASGHLRELHYGGWVAPNIYYLGAAGVVKIGGFRIAGMSGIYKRHDYMRGHKERVPMDDRDVRSVYHVRESDVRQLLQIRTQIDVGLSHDWPSGIEWLGDWKDLFRKKGHFEADARRGELGSVPAMEVLDWLRPKWWFSGHMHAKYVAMKDFGKENGTQTAISKPAVEPVLPPANEDEIDLDDLMEDGDMKEGEKKPAENTALPQTKNEDEIDLDDLMDGDGKGGTTPKPVVSEELRSQLPASFLKNKDSSSENRRKKDDLPRPDEIANTTVKFLALSKLVPNHEFLQLLELAPPTSTPADSTLLERPLKLHYDPEWLSILRTFAKSDPAWPLPQDLGTAGYHPQLEKQQKWVQQNIIDSGKTLQIPESFVVTAPTWKEEDGNFRSVGNMQPREYSSPQTQAFCKYLDIKNWFHEEEEALKKRHEKGMANLPKIDAQEIGNRGGHGGHRGYRGRGGRGGRGEWRGGRGRGGY